MSSAFDLDSYTFRFMARPWRETDFYTYCFWCGIWLKKLEKAKIALPPDWLEDQVQPQQMLCDSRATITSTGHSNHPPISAAIYVHLPARERAQLVSAPDVTWACVWCLVSHNITPLQICKSSQLWILCVMIKQWSQVPLTFSSNQNYVSKELFTTHCI